MVYRSRSSETIGWYFTVVLIMTAVVRVMSTYETFNHTYDEPTHIYSGLQLLDTSKYTSQRETPPLARLFLALGPYLNGARLANTPYEYKHSELAVLYGSGSYDRILSAARLGNIPFLLLLLLAAFVWAKHLFGMTAAAVSVAVLATLSPILGHAALATTDVACAATVLITFYILMRWLESQSTTWALLLGLSGGTAIMVKFSAIPFLASGITGVLLWRMLVGQPERAPGLVTLKCVRQIALMITVAIAVFWLSYGSVAPLQMATIHDKFDAGDLQTAVEEFTGKGTLAFKLVRGTLTEIPFPVFVRDMLIGLKILANHNAKGHWNYLFGEISRDGWWYYYLVELAVKTPIPLLFLGIYGLCFTTKRSTSERDWRIAMPTVCFVAILIGVSVTSRINSGVRHILILYPLLAITAGALISDFIARSKFKMTAFSAALLLWQATGSIAVHPDYMADFNLLAGKNPERILIDSDLDWGQDLNRLAQEVATRNIEHPAIAYYGNADVGQHIANFYTLQPMVPVTGWVAISMSKLAPADSGYRWLAAHKPVIRIGRSINLYFIGLEKTESREFPNRMAGRLRPIARALKSRPPELRMLEPATQEGQGAPNPEARTWLWPEFGGNNVSLSVAILMARIRTSDLSGIPAMEVESDSFALS